MPGWRDSIYGYVAENMPRIEVKRDLMVNSAIDRRAMHLILRHGFGAPAAFETAERMWQGALTNAGGNVEDALANFKPEIE
jgi:hypothetical protein